MKNNQTVLVSRQGKKKFDVEYKLSQSQCTHKYSGDGSYLRMTMAQTVEELLHQILKAFELQGEFKVTVSEIE